MQEERLKVLLSDDFFRQMQKKVHESSQQEQTRGRQQTDRQFVDSIKREMRELEDKKQAVLQIRGMIDSQNHEFLIHFKKAREKLVDVESKVKTAYDFLQELKHDHQEAMEYYFPTIAKEHRRYINIQTLDQKIERYMKKKHMQEKKQEEQQQKVTGALQIAMNHIPQPSEYYDPIPSTLQDKSQTNPSVPAGGVVPNKSALENNSMTYSQEVSNSQLPGNINTGRQSFGYNSQITNSDLKLHQNYGIQSQKPGQQTSNNVPTHNHEHTVQEQPRFGGRTGSGVQGSETSSVGNRGSQPVSAGISKHMASKPQTRSPYNYGDDFEDLE